jgi:hypothetical protein
LTILSFCFYFVFFYFIEQVEYSATTEESLYENSDFTRIDINIEHKDKKTGVYLYTLVSTRTESRIFEKYKNNFEIKESPPMIAFCGNEKPSIFTVIEVIIVMGGSFGCPTASYGDNVVFLPYTSKYLLIFSLFLLTTLAFVNLNKLANNKIIKNKFPFLLRTSNKQNQFIFILIIFLLIISFYFFDKIRDYKENYLEPEHSEQILVDDSGW